MRMLPTKWSGGSITYEHPVIMGILNVTPDSFSDGGAYAKLNSAAEHAFRLIDEGAGILDIGAESTRPGWKPVSAEEEIERLVPVIKEIAPSCDVPISVDTMKTRVAEAALDAGADIINDVYGLRWEGMAELAASAGVPVIIMHMYGEPESMHSDLMTGNVLPQIKEFFEERTKAALDAGIERNRIILDPGIGFGKTGAQNAEIMQSAYYFRGDHPVLIGSSRKRFLTAALGSNDDAASAKAAAIAADGGANIVRVHNVKATKDALYRKR